MSQFPKIDETSITIDALRELGSWTDVLRRETRLRACRIAMESGGELLVTRRILREAIVAACNEIVEQIRSGPEEDRKNDVRAA